jgi:hypothetical protein
MVTAARDRQGLVGDRTPLTTQCVDETVVRMRQFANYGAG